MRLTPREARSARWLGTTNHFDYVVWCLHCGLPFRRSPKTHDTPGAANCGQLDCVIAHAEYEAAFKKEAAA